MRMRHYVIEKQTAFMVGNLIFSSKATEIFCFDKSLKEI